MQQRRWRGQGLCPRVPCLSRCMMMSEQQAVPVTQCVAAGIVASLHHASSSSSTGWGGFSARAGVSRQCSAVGVSDTSCSVLRCLNALLLHLFVHCCRNV
eukprot:GHUV01028598.1.p1 GENE.GHUV01028598.1~~GHUV01028598.1.p1  ORF type:complete len:100 (-),score=18.29 GHUV01028598.1:232-531(-)